MSETERSATGQQNDRALEDELLREWCLRLIAALEVEGLEVDVTSVLDLAGLAARSVLRPAAPLTTFIVGYAAGQAAANGTSVATAVADATEVARQACREEQPATTPEG